MNVGRPIVWRSDCRGIRERLPDIVRARLGSGQPAGKGESFAVDSHLVKCPSCAEEYRMLALEFILLESSGATIVPDETFFAALRGRIAQEAVAMSATQPDEYWLGLVWITARQMIPAMAALLLLIFGASLMWARNSEPIQNIRPGDRVLFNEAYEYPQPTSDDVLETLVAIEDKKNGK
jgi:hypothetical protein